MSLTETKKIVTTEHYMTREDIQEAIKKIRDKKSIDNILFNLLGLSTWPLNAPYQIGRTLFVFTAVTSVVSHMRKTVDDELEDIIYSGNEPAYLVKCKAELVYKDLTNLKKVSEINYLDIISWEPIPAKLKFKRKRQYDQDGVYAFIEATNRRDNNVKIKVRFYDKDGLTMDDRVYTDDDGRMGWSMYEDGFYKARIRFYVEGTRVLEIYVYNATDYIDEPYY